jgi:glycosyltransferase involved in cell wall biosynthesis
MLFQENNGQSGGSLMSFPDKVSIILPTHNGARFLRDSISSCLNQTHTAIELIVVDDGSTDETPKILAELDDPRLIRVRHPQNLGLPKTLNTGFARATGQYLTWTSDDNYYIPEAIETLLKFLKDNPDVDFVYSDLWEINDQGEIIRKVLARDPKDLTQHNCVNACFLYQRKVYETLGDYNPEALLAEDFEYWLRVYCHFQMKPYNKPLYYYRVHDKSLSATGYIRYEARKVSARARRQILRLNWLSYAQQMSQIYIEEAFARYGQRDISGAFDCMMKGVSYNPGWLTNRGVLSVLAKSFWGRVI